MTTPEVRPRPWAILGVVCAAQFLTIIDLWIVNIALPTLRHTFAPAPLSAVSWILDGYAVVLTALLIPTGRIADQAGRRACFLTGLAGFGIASLGCGVAPALWALIAFRVLQAAAAALLMPVTLGLALPAFPPGRRGTVVGIWSAVAGVAAGGGPVLGGLLVAVNWRWIFLINVPVVAVALAAGIRLLPRDGRAGAAAGKEPARTWRWPDPPGTLLALGASGILCLALTEASAWPMPRTMIVIGAGLLLAVAFGFHIRRSRDPLVSPRLFTARAFSAGAAGLLAYYVGFAALLLGTTLLLTDGMHYSALHAAVAIAPAPAANTVLSPFSGHLTARLGSRGAVASGAMLFGAAAAWPLLHAGAVSYAAIVLPSMLLWGTANALIYPTLFRTADSVPPAELTSGLGVLNMGRQLGSALGIALAVAVAGTGATAAAGKLPQGGHAWLVVLVSAVLTGGAGLALKAPPERRERRRAPANGRSKSRAPATARGTNTAERPGLSRFHLRAERTREIQNGGSCSR